jgi:hypothetical protein
MFILDMEYEMNERIKQLAREAGAHISTRNLMSNPPQHVETVELWDDKIEKFAELIVKEMCGMMEQTEDDLYAMDPSERPTEYIEWLYYWRTRFEKHFRS